MAKKHKRRIFPRSLPTEPPCRFRAITGQSLIYMYLVICEPKSDLMTCPLVFCRHFFCGLHAKPQPLLPPNLYLCFDSARLHRRGFFLLVVSLYSAAVHFSAKNKFLSAPTFRPHTRDNWSFLFISACKMCRRIVSLFLSYNIYTQGRTACCRNYSPRC